MEVASSEARLFAKGSGRPASIFSVSSSVVPISANVYQIRMRGAVLDALLGARCSVLGAQCSVLGARCSAPRAVAMRKDACRGVRCTIQPVVRERTPSPSRPDRPENSDSLSELRQEQARLLARVLNNRSARRDTTRHDTTRHDTGRSGSGSDSLCIGGIGWANIRFMRTPTPRWFSDCTRARVCSSMWVLFAHLRKHRGGYHIRQRSRVLIWVQLQASVGRALTNNDKRQQQRQQQQQTPAQGCARTDEILAVDQHSTSTSTPTSVDSGPKRRAHPTHLAKPDSHR
jgi:hypothetical protein